MTVASTTTKVSYSGNGSTTVFTVPFYFLAASDLRVILRSAANVETVQTLTTQYTVTGAGVTSGGSVTMLTAPASGTTLTILRNVSPTQETDLLPNDRLPAESLETALDKATMLIQQLDEVADRALQYPASDAAVSPTLPAAVTRAGKFLSFDANGLPSATIGTDATTDVFLQSGVGAVSRSVNAKLRDTVSVKDFGAVGNGVVDDAPAIQAAVDAIRTATGGNGGALYFPAGTYNLASPVIFDSFFSLVVDFNGSFFNWRGSNTGSAFILRDCQSCFFSNAWINTSPSYPMQSGFRIQNGAGVSTTPNKCIFTGITMDGGNVNGMQYGFHIDETGAGGDANNDFHRFIECASLNHTQAGFYITGTQTFGVMILNCAMISAPSAVASCGIKKTDNGGSLIVIGGGSANHTDTFLRIAGPGRSTTIMNMATEQDASLLRTEGSGGQFFPVNLINCHWEYNTSTGVIADKRVIDFTYQGQLTIDGCQFRNSDPSADFVLRVTNGAGYVQNSGIIRGSSIMTGAANPLVGFWSVDDTSVRDREPSAADPLLLNAKIFGTGQPNGVNGAQIELNGARTLVFESGSVTFSDIVQSGGIRGMLGQVVTLIFRTAVTVQNGANIKLDGGVDFSATANDTLVLVFNGSGVGGGSWLEVSRKVL